MSCPYKDDHMRGFTYLYKCMGSYPKDYIDRSHANNYCFKNDQNNEARCNFFPQDNSWHYCHNCNQGVYDTDRYCPNCDAEQ